MSHTPGDAVELDPQDAYAKGWSDIHAKLRAGGSWSGRERNCVFLNTGETRFADASAPSGLDFPDDGRSLALVDWDHDGDLDLLSLIHI